MDDTKNDTDRHTAAKGVPAQHAGYKEEMQTLFAEINSVTDNVATPTYTNTEDMIQALQGLHISELLGFEDDGADEEGPNDMDAPLRAIQGATKDYTMGGSEKLQAALGALIEKLFLATPRQGALNGCTANGVFSRHEYMGSKPE